MSEFGERLRNARETRGVSLRQIAAATKISITALEALERGDYARLPGGIFSRAFVRAYALEIGLDPEQAVNDFLVEYGQREHDSAETEAPEVSADDRAFLERQRKAALALRAALIVIVLGIVGLIVMWQVHRNAAKNAAPLTTPAVERLPPPPPSSPPAAAPAPAVSAPAAGAAAQNARLDVAVEATAECWMQVTVDGTIALARILTAGEHEQFRANTEVQLQFGNAGAVKWTINGRAAKPLGKWGSTGKAKLTKANVADFLQ